MSSRQYSLPWRLAFLVTAALLPVVAQGSHAVNVALSAAFNSPPYLVELLETAAEENTTSYFPILDRIADGVFAESRTDKDLYDRFLHLLQDDGHIADSEGLSSFKLAMALRSTAPRIQAHYQYYNTSVEPSLMVAQDAVCPVWAHYGGSQYCSPSLGHAQQGVSGDQPDRVLPFDRVLGDQHQSSLVLYADISNPMFGGFHKEFSRRAAEGEFSYRIRYRPTSEANKPLYVSGYGVELALKRTDYIVIDDRDAEKSSSEAPSDANATPAAKILKEESPADLKPLSASEVSNLGINAASFVMDSDNPFETLQKLSQDFPKHSSLIAHTNATSEFLHEFETNQQLNLPPGYDAIWINGVQIDHRHINAFSLLNHLRHERKLINSFRELGLSARDAVNLLSNPAIAKAQAHQDVQRYDYRDETEGGEVIIWLNDIEKDKRYAGWAKDLTALLQRTFPGQLPQVRRDIHNVVLPVNLADSEDVQLLVGQIQMFVKRQIPVRFGLVPILQDPASIEQAKIAHYLYDTYGLVTLMKYFENSLEAKKVAQPDKQTFETAIEGRHQRTDRDTLDFEAVLGSEEFVTTLSSTESYLKRLAIEAQKPICLVNGAIIPRNDNWMQLLVSRVSRDLEGIQLGVFNKDFKEDDWLPQHYLKQAVLSRNPLISPEDPSDVKILDLDRLYKEHKSVFDTLPRITTKNFIAEDWASMILVADFDSEHGAKQLSNLVEFREMHPEIEVLLLHYGTETGPVRLSAELFNLVQQSRDIELSTLTSVVQGEPGELEIQEPDTALSGDYFSSSRPLAADLGAEEGGITVILNGRVVGPIPSSSPLAPAELDQLVAYERRKRLDPAFEALASLQMVDNVQTAFNFARLTSLIAHATDSDTPEGIFDSGPNIRSDDFTKWSNEKSGITISNSEDPSIQIAAAINPASEAAQRFIPILKVLSNLSGVSLKIYLNPQTSMKELPIKRFYRHVLQSEPSFNDDGVLKQPRASFTAVPEDALLTLGMDVPPSWLVAPKDSIHDLDNILLSSLKEGTNVDAIYELQHILIEGHSRENKTGSAPRGVQLLLGTERNPQLYDTIIMANLGYFQFKAQPGYWQIGLKSGPSERIFKLDSVGGMGYTPKPGDENNEVALLSFQGKTLYPRLSRKPGHEEDDVLEAGGKTGSAKDYVSKGFKFASGVISGMKGTQKKDKHADINIFSVASGHLYERMLNIMMVSVMRHTQHSVKFWFIEQFLSPSFKSFLPHLAKEFGFSYEMVTYKWPHWLRAQSEKQRQIWGYKILFLDVLFPLSLDKVIFVDADQIVRTDMYDLITHDLDGAPYGFTPMCDSRTEIEGFRFWKQGYWAKFLNGLPYHISALYVVDLNRFREIAAGDRLRGQYHTLSADPNSLSNLDQDLPNHMQHVIPIKSLEQDWLWCETWCADEALKTARTIDLCNNPMTKEPKLDRARRQVPEWTAYDEEIAELGRKVGERQKEEERGEQGEERGEEQSDIKDEL